MNQMMAIRDMKIHGETWWSARDQDPYSRLFLNIRFDGTIQEFPIYPSLGGGGGINTIGIRITYGNA